MTSDNIIHMIQISILGTTSNAPTKERNHPAVHLRYKAANLLFDCGENAQQQMMKLGLSIFKIDAVFISHLHADHILGLGGLIQTMAIMGRQKELFIYGPPKIKKYVDFFLNWENFKCGFPIKPIEVKEGRVHEDDDYTVTAFGLKHSVPCFGYVFEEKVERNLNKKKLKEAGLYNKPECGELKAKGKIKWNGKTIKIEDVSDPLRSPRKVVYCMDTQPTENIIKHAKNADLIICEGTYDESLKEKAHEYYHMTTKDAARIAQKARAKKLLITHFSPRYDDLKPLEKEAKQVFKNTVIAKDLMQLEI